jgi:hypothetical protein
MFFIINQSSDLGVDWTNLWQMAVEDLLEFANYLAGILNHYQKLLGMWPAPERECEALSMAIEELHQAEPDQGSLAQIHNVTTTMNAFTNANQTTGQALVVNSLQTCKVADRLTDS